MKESKLQAADQLVGFFNMIRRIISNLLLNEFSIFQAYQLGSFDHNKFKNKKDSLVMDCMKKRMKLITFLEDSN